MTDEQIGAQFAELRTELRATKGDIKDLKAWLLEREVQTIRWMVGTQIAYCAITLSAVWFLITHR